MPASRWSRLLLIVGLAAMVLGVLDPLEGSVVILAGTGLVALAAMIGKSRHRAFIAQSFVLVLIGVGAMLALSALGGIGGNTGRSYWWLLFVLPYPVGWLMGLMGAIRRLREPPAAA